jgi:hypothetical protein
MGLAVSEENFYSMKDSFISILASFLKINPRYISIVDVVPGNARRSLSGHGDSVRVAASNRALLSESVTVSFEVAPEASLSVDTDVSVLENVEFATVTITRATNVSCCSVYCIVRDFYHCGIHKSLIFIYTSMKCRCQLQAAWFVQH